MTIDEGKGLSVMDPLKVTLEELLYVRLGHFFDQLNGRVVPELYRVLLDQVDRAVLRQALERFDGQLGAAAKFLGVDRNTFARKAKRLSVNGVVGQNVKVQTAVKDVSRSRKLRQQLKAES